MNHVMFDSFGNAFLILYRKERRPVLVLAVTMLLSIPIMPLELMLVQYFIDQIGAWTARDSMGSILMTAVWIGVLMFVNNIVLGVPVPLAMTRLNEVGTLEEQRMIVEKTSKLPLLSIESATVKDLRERAVQVSIYEIYHTGLQILQLSLQLSLLMLLILQFGQWIPVVTVVGVAFLLSYVSGKSAASLEHLQREQASHRRMIRYYADLMTERSSAKEVRMFGLGTLFMNRWNALYQKQSKDRIGVVRASEIHKFLPELLLAVIASLLMALVILLPGSKPMTSGDFALLYLALTTVLSQLPELINQITTMKRHAMKWQDFRAYLDLKEDSCIRENNNYVENGACNLQLQVQELWFRYPDSEVDSIQGISFTVPSGRRVALVGENGSGKSTLVKLILGLYPPKAGEITWLNTREGSKEHVTGSASISAVFQDFTRLHLTVRENVGLGKVGVMMHDGMLIDSLETAGSKFTNLDMQLGVPFGGIDPSGGEWQKIATARAILRDASFIVFDEPTAALDPQAERAAFEQFIQLTEGRSALLITHRLGAAKLADMILVMQEGRIVEQGTHDELMLLNGEYRRMFDVQASWYV
ncbi:ABC transporter ATP-binding protein [Paenibacillus terrigena]|uniref:ABC transporter ATP-binding protein n=1 Tax=Paenibacillus terrigena TaxID=369333 RepID=UPI000364E182|nr:ABC transporter ATP-binding protein [Paenibacillus terrigena]